jgi:hypothetical protein
VWGVWVKEKPNGWNKIHPAWKVVKKINNLKKDRGLKGRVDYRPASNSYPVNAPKPPNLVKCYHKQAIHLIVYIRTLVPYDKDLNIKIHFLKRKSIFLIF